MVHKQHDFQSKLIKEMAIPMPFPLTGGPFYDYQVRKKRLPFMAGRRQQQHPHPQTYGQYTHPDPLHHTRPSDHGPEGMSFEESHIDLDHQPGGASGQEGSYYTHGDPFQDSSSQYAQYGQIDPRKRGDIEQGYSLESSSTTGSYGSDHLRYQPSSAHVRRPNSHEHNWNNNSNHTNSSASTLGSQHVKNSGQADSLQRTDFERNQGLASPARNTAQGDVRSASENDIMPWGPSTTHHVSLPFGASAPPPVNPHAAQSSSSAWSRLPRYQALAQSMLGDTGSGHGLATGSEARQPAAPSREDGSIGAMRTQRRAG